MKIKMKQTVYKMTLHIYPVADCGEDLSTGEPISIESEGDDVYELKRRITSLILYTMTTFKANDGECFLEMSITKDGGDYFDRDEGWVTVDLNSRTVEYNGHF